MSTPAIITIEGYVGRDPEIRYFESGSILTELSVACSQGTGDEKHTDWFKVKIWGKSAEFVAENFKKGDPVGVVGDFATEEWTAQDGTVRTSLVVNAFKTWFPARKSDGEGQQKQQSKPQQQKPQQQKGKAVQQKVPF